MAAAAARGGTTRRGGAPAPAPAAEAGTAEAAVAAGELLEASRQEAARGGLAAYVEAHVPRLAEGGADAVRNLDRLFAPWPDACALCWDAGDEEWLEHGGGGSPAHSYCAAGGDEPLVFARGSGGVETWRLARLLGEREWAEWDAGDRAALLSALCGLVAESPALHDRLSGEEDKQRETRRALALVRAELRD